MLQIITLSHTPPDWAKVSFKDYMARLPKHITWELLALTPPKRSKNMDTHKLKQLEGKKLLQACKPNSFIIALDENGKQWSSQAFAKLWQDWQAHHPHISFLIGGADGLSDECLSRANLKWSLSALTFPHQLVRVLLAEQLYRASTISRNHPYHRD